MEHGRADHPVELEPAIPSGSGSHRAAERRPDPSVTFRRLDPSYSDAVLPAAFLGVTLLGALFVLIVLVAWLRSHAAGGRRRSNTKPAAAREPLRCPFTADRFGVAVKSCGDCPEEKENIPIDDFAFRLPRILDDPVDLKFEDEAEARERNVRKPPVAHMRKSAGGRLAVPAGDRTDSDGDGVQPTFSKEEPADASEVKVPDDCDDKAGKFKVALAEKHWILHGKPPSDWRSYSLNKAFGLSRDVAGPDRSALIPAARRCSSATRSPSLEKDEKSPFLQRGDGKNAQFCFGRDAVERCTASAGFRSGNSSPVIQVRVQPESTDCHCALEMDHRRSKTPESPNITGDGRRAENNYLRRAGSLNGDMRSSGGSGRSVGSNAVANVKTIGIVDFKGEFKRQQKDKYLRKTASGTRFDKFSDTHFPAPLSLDGLDFDTNKREKCVRRTSETKTDTIVALDDLGRDSTEGRYRVRSSSRMPDSAGKENGPGFDFSPGSFDSESPKFFVSGDAQRSPNFFAENQSRNASPKSFRADGPPSPKISAYGAYKAGRSPLIMDSSGNRFKFDRVEDGVADNKMNDSSDEVDCVFLIKAADDADISDVDLGDNEKTDLEKLSPQPFMGADNHISLVEARNDILLNDMVQVNIFQNENNVSDVPLLRGDPLSLDESYRMSNSNSRSGDLSQDNSLKVSGDTEELTRKPSLSRRNRPALSRDNSFNIAIDDPPQDEKISRDKIEVSRDNSLNVSDISSSGANLSRRKSALLSRENSFNVTTEESEREIENCKPVENLNKELCSNNEMCEESAKYSNKPLLSVAEDGQDSLSIPLTGSTANYRRQRLKSISLDSDNAKFIEQNLGIPIVKHLRQENLYDMQTDSKSSQSGSYDNEDNDSDSKFDDENVQRQIALPAHKDTYFKFGDADMIHVYAKFDNGEISHCDVTDGVQSDHVLRTSPELTSPVKYLRDNSSAISFSEMQPRFSPKEFDSFSANDVKMSKVSKNIRNLTIDINKRDEDLEKELLEYDRLDSASEKRITPKTPTLKIKATSLDSSETLNLSLPQSNTLQVPQNSISVPNTPKRQLKQALSQKSGKLVKSNNYGGNLNDIPRVCPENQQRKLYMNVKCPANFKDSGIFLRENHANLMLFQASRYTLSRGVNSAVSNFSRRMGSFDENMVDLTEVSRPGVSTQGNGREFLDHRLSLPQKHGDGNFLGSNLLSFKQNLSVSSTNLKTLPEGVPSNDFETQPDVDKLSKRTLLQRRGSNQSLTINLDGTGSNLKYSTLSLQGSNLSLASFGASNYNLNNIKNSASNFSLNTDNRQKKNILERRNSNTSLTLTLDCSNQHGRLYSGSNCNLQSSHYNLSNTDQQSTGQNKKCLLQRRGSNTSLTLNLQGSSGSNLNRCTSNSSLNIHNNNTNIKIGQKKGLLERRSSNNSLTLNINGGNNSQFDPNRVLSVSNYNLDGSGSALSRYNSNQSISNAGEQNKKGLLERRSSNTSLTLNLNSSNHNLQACNDVPRDIEIDEVVMHSNLAGDMSQMAQQREKHRKSLSTENLFPKSYKSRTFLCKNTDNVYSFGSHDNLWSSSYVSESMENMELIGGNNLTYIGGDQENEMIYAFGGRQHIENAGFPTNEPMRNITTKPLSPHSTSEDFKMYLANIQHLQNASNILTRKQLKDLNSVFREGYSKSDCSSLSVGKKSPTEGIASQLQHLTLERVFPSVSSDDNPLNEGEYNPQRLLPEPGLPCPEYQKSLLRNLHQEFWDLPTNFQEKPMVFGSHPKNRYKTILPNEHSRVILRAEAGDTDEGYINANYVKGHDYSKNCFIATQGPLQNTVYDFWLMVYQNSSQFHKDGCTKTNEDRHFGSPRARNKHTREISEEKYPDGQLGTQKIVMLTNLVENGRQKCEKYFPLELNEELLFQHVVNSSYSSACSGGNFFPDNGSDETKLEDFEANSFKIKNIGILNKVGYTVRKLNVVYKNKFLKSTPKSSDIFKDDLLKIDIEILNNTKENVKIVVDTPVDADDDISKKKSEDDTTDSLIVYHYWFDNWADHKCPKDVTALLDLSLDVLQSCELDFDTEVNAVSHDLTARKNSFSTKVKSFDRPDNPGDNKLSIDKSITYFDFSSYSHDSRDHDSNRGSTVDIDTEGVPKERRLSAFQLAKAFFDEASRANSSSEEITKNVSGRKSSLAGRLDLSKPRQDSIARRESTGKIDFKKNIAALKPVVHKSIRDSVKKTEQATLSVVQNDNDRKVNVKGVKKVLSLNKIDAAMPPIIVHCSAGIGRTGCLIAILNGIRQLKVDQRVDILGIVCNMRLNRGGMVQNSEQYELIHKVLCLYEDIGLPDVE